MGISNVLNRHLDHFRAANIMAKRLGLNPENMAIALMAKMLLENGGTPIVELTTAYGMGDLRNVGDYWPVSGNQYDETFDVVLLYGLDMDEPDHQGWEWENEVVMTFAGLLHAKVGKPFGYDEAVMAVILLMGESILQNTQISLATC